MLWFIIVLLFLGVIFGALARLLVPGPDPMGIVATWAVGVAGSLLGGFLGAAIFGFDSEDGALQMGGLISSIVGAVLLVVAIRIFSRNRSTA